MRTANRIGIYAFMKRRRLTHRSGIACDQRQQQREQAEDFAEVQRMVAEYLQHVGQQSNAGTEEDEPDNVERVGALFAIVGQVQMDQTGPTIPIGRFTKQYPTNSGSVPCIRLSNRRDAWQKGIGASGPD
jgi:hypothetical protein